MSWNTPRDRLEESQRFFEAFLGTSAVMRTVLTHVEDAARAATPVLIRGEAGTGKELVARIIHARGGDPFRPFCAINASALTTPLLEAQLFGSSRGPGVVALAHHGTLLLDEITDMPEPFISRVLETKDIRVIATANSSGTFERLGAHEFQIPPLRARPEDLSSLVEYLLARLARMNGLTGQPNITIEAFARLREARWTSNLRELEYVLERSLQNSGTAVIREEHLPSAFHGQGGTRTRTSFDTGF